MKHFLLRTTSILALAATLIFAPLAQASEPVVVRLPFQRPQFQFAGYYVAQAKGYYRDAGVDVELLPTTVDVNLSKVVALGTAQFGVSNASILLDRLNGGRFVVLADIMQHSPLVLFTLKRPDIQKLGDLKGRRIEIANLDRSLEIVSMLSHDGIGTKDYQRIADHWSFEDLVSGRTDAISAYITAQSYTLESRKIPFQVFNPRDHGIDFYSDALFTTEDYVEQHGKIVDAVRNATLKGWRYAMAHQDETIDILLKQPEASHLGLTRPMLQYEAKAMDEFILPNLMPIGEVNVERWKMIADSLVAEGLAKSTSNFEGFVYDVHAIDRNTLIWRITLGIGIGVILALIALIVNFQLRRLVRRRTTELEEASRQLLHGQKIQAIGTLANGIGHDINNILSIILLNTTVLLQKTKDPDQIQSINVIREALERGSRISKQILQFSSNQPSEPERVDLPHLIEQLRQFITTSLPSAVKLTCLYPIEPVWVRGDSTQLYQAFLNLVVNARDALHNRGTIAIDFVVQENTVEVRVRDNGVGMAPEVVQRVFEPFFTTKGIGTGSGLGLSIVHGIITSHGGHAKVESEKGKGTTVRIFLPRLHAADVSEATDNEPQVLVAEDEAGIRSIIVMALRDEGYRVCSANDGLEAWRLFEKHQRSLRAFVSDVGLPKLSGSEVMSRVLQIKPSIGVIAISGFVEDGQLQLPPQAHLLQKPFAIEELVATVVSFAGPAHASQSDLTSDK